MMILHFLLYKLPTSHIPGVDDQTTDNVADYYQNVVDANGVDKDGNNDQHVHVPIFYAMQQNFYPVALLFKNIDIDPTTGAITLSNFDTDLLKNQTKAIYLDPENNNKVRDGYDSDDNRLQYLDLEKLNDKFAQFMTFITTMVPKNTDPDNYKVKYKSKYFNGNIDIAYYSKIYKSILGSDSSANWLKVLE